MHDERVQCSASDPHGLTIRTAGLLFNRSDINARRATVPVDSDSTTRNAHESDHANPNPKKNQAVKNQAVTHIRKLANLVPVSDSKNSLSLTAPQALTLLQIHLETGQRHQIRCHLSEVLGHPIANDALYGGSQMRKLVELGDGYDVRKGGGERERLGEF